MPIEMLALVGGMVAGFLGALVGIGGGVFLVPLLHGLMGLSFREATAVSLVAVLGTSSSAAMVPAGRRLLNARLAVLLLLFSVSGATLGARWMSRFSDATYELIFGVTALVIAAAMFVRLNRRNVRPAGAIDPGVLGGRVYDDDLGTEVVYRVTRLPVAAAVSFAAGVLASFIGIGGGILIVPALNSLCGVPLRVAAATSVIMIGVTAVPGVAAHWAGGYLNDFHLAALTTFGAMIGFQIGAAVGPRAPVLWLKIVMGAILTVVAVQYLMPR
jgi:hypothetical protein